MNQRVVKKSGNPDPKFDIDNYVCKDNEVIIYCPVYNKSTGVYGGLTKKVGYITLRGDSGERFLSYGYNKENRITEYFQLYCIQKTYIFFN